MDTRIPAAILVTMSLVSSVTAAQGVRGTTTDRGATVGITVSRNPPAVVQPLPQPPSGPLVPVAPPSARPMPIAQFPLRPQQPVASMQSTQVPGGPIVPVPPPSPFFDTPDVFLAGPDTYVPGTDRFPVFPGYGGFLYADGYVDPRYAAPRQPATEPRGLLRLQILPADAQVLVDGFYVGVVQEFATGRLLRAGPHRLEIRADGFDTMTLDVRIDTNQTVTVRRDLQRTQRVEAPAVARAPAKTFYVIPGCYAGDTRPTASDLPARCTLANLRVIPPVVAPAAR